MRLLYLFSLLLFPCVSLAAIQISEIAWMGSVDSANHEWIELYNTGDSVSVDGWILHDAANLTIELEGTISANSHVVLERTSDSSAPGSAFLLYTGALSNSGATLVLRNSAGDVVDQVIGGDSWEKIGGNNETKDTPQLRSGVWSDGVPTPGESAGAVVSDIESDISDTSAVSKVKTEQKRVTLPDVSLQLQIEAPVQVHVGQSTKFSVKASGVGKTIIDSLSYEWNLGNGDRLFGKEVSYTFNHPGQYVVVVAGEYKRQKQFTRQIVEVLPVELKISTTDDKKFYVIENTSNVEVDIGGYQIVGSSKHVFPKHTIVLPTSKLVIASALGDSRHATVALHDSRGQIVSVHIPGVTNVAKITSKTYPTTFSTQTFDAPIQNVVKTNPELNFGFASDNQLVTQTDEVDLPPVVVPAAQMVNIIETDKPSNQTDWPLYGLIVLLLLGTAGIYLVPQKKDDPPWV